LNSPLAHLAPELRSRKAMCNSAVLAWKVCNRLIAKVLRAYTPFLFPWIVVFIFKGLWKPEFSFLHKICLIIGTLDISGLVLRNLLSELSSAVWIKHYRHLKTGFSLSRVYICPILTTSCSRAPLGQDINTVNLR